MHWKLAAQYLQLIVDEIVKANQSLQGKTFKCYFSRSGVPNATYIGEGIILFHMGLFQRLENESQAAFVIGHELAHFLLQHSENGIDKYSKAVPAFIRNGNSGYLRRCFFPGKTAPA